MNNLPSVYQSIYYVYFHKDLLTNEIVYVGKGSRGRAWHCAESNSRGKEHSEWMTTLINAGYTPDQWTYIFASGLTQVEAFSIESDLREEHKPIYNSTYGQSCILSDEDLVLIKELRDIDKLSYKVIADEIGCSTMTVYRAYKGETKHYVI